MNYSFKFRNVALSALLLTAISAPVVANADSDANANAVTNGTATLKEAKFSIAAFTMANPVELAKKYAPDTVSEWEKTLANYNKLLSQTSMSAGLASLVAVDIDSDQWKGTSENAKPDEMKEMQTLKIEGVKAVKAEQIPHSESKNTLSFSITTSSADLKKLVENAKPGEAVAISTVELDEKTTGVTSAVIADAETFQISGIDPTASAFFKAQTNLNNAVSAKDSAAIKTSLAELLKQYKEQIVELEANQE
ncbi:MULTISPECIES: hypothetical protein [unclassified Paenibacillus]|uniref:hypothetical protein n=1 Tax=unclassified Paenibacillus TaxID=185978 RepID=UPI0003FCFBFF|nr:MULTISPECIES: hypothetical protein [unclassified Paenibacillus]KGP78753.1 hypothetical protein P364_0126500 [Paenibacillus sp. MAEPY2]KGP88767.1 hypothetical protein P363_0105885 [Paenibacillus sp. MAEPY1]